jgi:hypothetical protein
MWHTGRISGGRHDEYAKNFANIHKKGGFVKGVNALLTIFNGFQPLFSPYPVHISLIIRNFGWQTL